MYSVVHPASVIMVHMQPGETPPSQQQRLARYVEERRLQLGLSVRAAAAAAGVARGTWIALEDATRRTARTAYAGIENTLKWQPGSVDAVLDGGEPTPVDPATETTLSGSFAKSTHIGSDSSHPADLAIIRVMRYPDLSDDQKARIVRAVIAEQQRVGEQFADELIAQARGEKQ